MSTVMFEKELNNISSNIELDYKNIGILKSVGMTNSSIRISVMLGYLVIAMAGMLLGIPLSIPVIKFINNTTITTVGIYLSNQLNPVLIVVMILIVMMMIGIFVLITVIIVCDKIIIKEKKDYGIYKSIGFTNKSIRLQLAIRFAIVAFLGSVFGIILFLSFSNEMFDAIFSKFGIYTYESQMTWLSFIIPVVLMVTLFTIFAYIKAGKVKKTEVRILIVE